MKICRGLQELKIDESIINVILSNTKRKFRTVDSAELLITRPTLLKNKKDTVLIRLHLKRDTGYKSTQMTVEVTHQKIRSIKLEILLNI